jgi:hypothetical protein
MVIPTAQRISPAVQTPNNRPYQVLHFKNTRITISEYQNLAASHSNAGRVVIKGEPPSDSGGTFYERNVQITPANASVGSQTYSRHPAAVPDIAQRNISPPASPTSSDAMPEHPMFILRVPPPTVSYSGIHPLLGQLKFDEIVTIAKQSLELLAQFNSPIYLNPSKMIFDPQSRLLSIIWNQGIFYSQFLGGPFYLSPEMILGEMPDSSADIWSLGCILFEMLTGESLFISDFAIPLLHQMISQIGMPPLSFLQRCRSSEMFFTLEPEVRFCQKLSMTPIHWKQRVLFAGKMKEIPPEKLEGFIQLLEKMISYENRCPPPILLSNSLFHDDVRFYLPPNFTLTDKISIFRSSEMDACLYQNWTGEPLSRVEVNGSRRRAPLFVHVHRDPEDLYDIFIERNGMRLLPVRLTMRNNDVLSFLQLDRSADPILPA